jgi:hypothetical protein
VFGGTEQIETASSALLLVYSRSDGAERPEPAAQNFGVGFLVTALPHLHVRNLARRFEWVRFAANDKFFSRGFS